MFISDLNIYREFDDQIREIYKSIPLICISDTHFDNNITVRKKSLREYNQFQFHLDILSLNQDIKFLTGLVYFFHPFINRESDTYFQTVADKRYLLFCGLTHQTLYNYWDRIGDLLALYFDTGLKERDIYFLKVIEKFPSDYQTSQHYRELKDLADKNLKKLLDDRRIIVHYLQLNTKYYTEFVLNKEEREGLINQKENFPSYFKKHLDLSVRGFELTLRLINELPDKND